MSEQGEVIAIVPAPVDEQELHTRTTYVREVAQITVPTDATVVDQMNVIEASGTLDFWADPKEDRYDETDGNAV